MPLLPFAGKPAMGHTQAMDTSTIRHEFTGALDALVEPIKHDRSILAAILCGSLSHDTVWSRSDIDLVLVTIDDKKVESDSISLYADGVNVHALLYPRAEFRKMVEGSLRNSFPHSFLAKGRLLYTHDDTIAELFASLRQLGDRDRGNALFRAATAVLPPLYKAHKWMKTRGDLEYTALWILYAATPLAQIEVISAGLVADREVIPQATKLNPELFATIYTALLNSKKTTKQVQAALDTVDAYLRERAAQLFAPLIEHLREVGEARSCTEIDDHFRKTMGIEFVTTACEYLADMGMIGKASTAARLTKRSNVDVQELAFYAVD
jgi:hypothetical protein